MTHTLFPKGNHSLLLAGEGKVKSLYRILPGDFSKWVPPDPISNSEVKPFSANDSVDSSMPKSVIARLLSLKPLPNKN